jgi:hypothetical protein
MKCTSSRTMDAVHGAEVGVEHEMGPDPGAEVGGEQELSTSVVGHHEPDPVSESGESVERRCPKRNRKAINQPYDAYLFVSAVGRKPRETYAKAQASAEWPLWRGAMNSEFQSLFERGEYEVISRDEMPEGKQAIPSK